MCLRKTCTKKREGHPNKSCLVSFVKTFSKISEDLHHDLRRTTITRALEMGQTYRQVQMMSKHKDPKTVMRYDHGRENLDQNAVNFLGYDEE